MLSTMIKKKDTHSRLYIVWRNMRNRCFKPTDKRFPHYGGRGITVCQEWLSFQSFKKWAKENGYEEHPLRGVCTLDRIDNNGNYSPNNCRWVSNFEQANNKSSNHLMSHNGETLTMSEWARRLGMTYNTLNNRVCKLGWDDKRALTEPVRKKRQ